MYSELQSQFKVAVIKLTCRLVPRRGTLHSPLFEEKRSFQNLGSMRNFGMEWQDSGSLIDVFSLDIDSANRIVSVT